jgi:hypothetical protein
MCVFGYTDESLPKEPSPELDLWMMSTENICMSIYMEVANQTC